MLSPFEQAILLGILHGLTDFLPVSSDGHLALAEMLLEGEGGGLTHRLLLYTGSLLATLLYLRQRIAQVSIDLWQHIARGRLPEPSAPSWDAVLVAIAAVPTGLCGLALHDTMARWSAQPLAIGFGFIITALLLTSTLWTRSGAVSSPSLWAAVMLGLAQGLAFAPGLSRSGLTIVAALWLGVRAERAFELSMLMSIPALAGAVLLELTLGEPMPAHVAPLICGGVAALLVGLLALGLLRRAVLRGHMAWFALWLLPVALATLALAKAWPS